MTISVVQAKTGTITNSASATLTLASTTAGNCLVVCCATYNSGTGAVTGITLGGSAGNFAYAAGWDSTPDAEIWVDANCAGGQTALVVTFSGTHSSAIGIAVIAYEVSGLVTSGAVDKVSAASAYSTAITSGATAATTAAAEIWVGLSYAYAATITGPSSPWTNTTLSTFDSYSSSLVAGYQVVSSTGAATYASTATVAGPDIGAVVTLKGAVPPPVARRNPLPMQAVNRATYW